MCFSLGWIEQLLVWLVIVCAVVAILKILLPWVAGQLGGVIPAVINIVLWAVIAIFVIYFCFALIECLASFGGGRLPLFPR